MLLGASATALGRSHVRATIATVAWLQGRCLSPRRRPSTAAYTRPAARGRQAPLPLTSRPQGAAAPRPSPPPKHGNMPLPRTPPPPCVSSHHVRGWQPLRLCAPIAAVCLQCEPVAIRFGAPPQCTFTPCEAVASAASMGSSSDNRHAVVDALVVVELLLESHERRGLRLTRL